MISKNDDSVAKKILFFNGQLRGTSPYWARRSVELRSLINCQVNKERVSLIFLRKGVVQNITSSHCVDSYHCTSNIPLVKCQIWITRPSHSMLYKRTVTSWCKILRILLMTYSTKDLFNFLLAQPS